MQAPWVCLASGLEEESQDAQNKNEEAKPHQAHARAAEEKDKRSVIGMPAATVMVGDKGIRGLFDLCILSIEALREDAYLARIIGCEGMGCSVESVLGRKEHRTGAEHDGWVVHDVRMVKGDEVSDGLLEEGVSLGGKHEIV